MYKKVCIVLALAIFGIAAGCTTVYAHGLAAAADAVTDEHITAEDLNVKEPTLLPSSPLYFFKNWKRGFQRAFTFNPIKKVELELRFTDEKIAETKKLAEVEPEKTQAVGRAIENYRASQERLKTRLTALEETSQNPNVEKLLEKLADRTIKHEKLFSELKDQFAGTKELQEKLEAAKTHIEESATEGAKKDDPRKFARKLEKALVESRGGNLKHVQSLEILDRIHEKAGGELKGKLSEIRNDFSKRLGEDLKAFVEKHEEAPQSIKEEFERLAGDKGRHLVIIEEIREQADRRVKDALKDTEEILEKVFEEREELEERAVEALRRAEERIRKLEEQLKSATPPPSVAQLKEEAVSHLREGRQALEEKKYGEAFGQARSAEVLARNALRMLEEREEPEDEDLKEDIARMQERISEWEKRIEVMSEEFRPEAKEALENAHMHLRFAIESLEKDAPREAKKHLEETKSALRLLERIYFGARKEPSAAASRTPAAAREERTACPLLTFPACEKNRERDECIRQIKEVVAKYPHCGFEKQLPGQIRRTEIKEPAVRTILPPATAPAPSRCGEFERTLVELKTLLGNGKITKEEFEKKSEITRKELSVCLESSASVQEAKPVLPPPAATAPVEKIVCTQEYNPVCGVNGKTYSNSCMAKADGMEIKYRDECGKPIEPSSGTTPPASSAATPSPATSATSPAATPTPTTTSATSASEPTSATAAAAPSFVELKIEADDNGFYPSDVIIVPKGSRVKLHFLVRTERVYYGGLDFRSSKFKTESVKPGGTTSVEFTADEPFVVTSYWPVLSVRKTDLKVELK